MNTEQSTEKHEHNRKTDEEEIETIKAELEMATEKVAYFENIINAANNLRKLAEAKIIQTQSKKLDSLSNKLDSQIQSLGELSLCQNHLKCFKFQIKALNSIFS